MDMQLTGYDSPVTTTISSFLANLPELLGSMFTQGSRVLCIADFTDYRYVQFWAEGNTLVAEVISNMHLEERPLTTEQEQMLVDDGWNPPSIDGTPNFWMEVRSLREIPTLTRFVQRAVVDVLGQGRSPELMTCEIKTWDPGNIPYLSRDEARSQSRVRLQENDHDDEESDR
jgi:hypothetical protein